MPWSGRDRCYLRNTRAATMFSIVADTPLSGVQNARRRNTGTSQQPSTPIVHWQNPTLSAILFPFKIANKTAGFRNGSTVLATISYDIRYLKRCCRGCVMAVRQTTGEVSGADVRVQQIQPERTLPVLFEPLEDLRT
jgi:hypothetical protein